jgi:hypothetical protein
VVRHIFQACPVWIYTQSNITSIISCVCLQFLKGSTEQGVVVNNTLTPVIFARYITILPKECTGACALRAEFYGCYEGKLAILKINW